MHADRHPEIFAAVAGRFWDSSNAVQCCYKQSLRWQPDQDFEAIGECGSAGSQLLVANNYELLCQCSADAA
jgi:hypothetical protein